jgi:hypothetical protein
LLKRIVCESDPAFFLTDSIVLLMGETDTEGALKAVERYQALIGPVTNIRYSIASFPGDGMASEDLIDTAHRRLKTAQELDDGSVFTEG